MLTILVYRSIDRLITGALVNFHNYIITFDLCSAGQLTLLIYEIDILAKLIEKVDCTFNA